MMNKDIWLAVPSHVCAFIQPIRVFYYNISFLPRYTFTLVYILNYQLTRIPEKPILFA